MREIKRDEVPKAGADDLPAPEIAVSHPPARETAVQPAPDAPPGRRRELTFRAVATARVSRSSLVNGAGAQRSGRGCTLFRRSCARSIRRSWPSWR